VKLKYSPCKSDWDTKIEVLSESEIRIDDETYEFPIDGIDASDIAEQTDFAILEARQEDGVLYLTIRRFYSYSCADWDDGQYHEVLPC
jgi:hypothetical protein